MSHKTQIDKLWSEFRLAINRTYSEANADSKTFHGASDPKLCLRDYAEDISWNDALAALLGREAANERRHRNSRPSVLDGQGWALSVDSASKLILMECAANAAKLDKMPLATEFLVLRQTAAEARVIGFLARNYLSADWRKAVESLDYAKIMRGEQLKTLTLESRIELDRLAYSRKFVNRPLAIDCRFPPLVRIEPKPINHKARAIEYLFLLALCVAGWFVILWLGLHPHWAGDKALQFSRWFGF